MSYRPKSEDSQEAKITEKLLLRTKPDYGPMCIGGVVARFYLSDNGS